MKNILLCLCLLFSSIQIANAAEPKKWEYKVVSYNIMGHDKRTASELTKVYSAMGAEGWEIISVDLDVESGSALVTFKRVLM